MTGGVLGPTLRHMGRDVLRICSGRGHAPIEPFDATEKVVRTIRDADRLRGWCPDRVQIVRGGWDPNAPLSYLLEDIVTPMLLEGARLELVQ